MGLRHWVWSKGILDDEYNVGLRMWYLAKPICFLLDRVRLIIVINICESFEHGAHLLSTTP